MSNIAEQLRDTAISELPANIYSLMINTSFGNDFATRLAEYNKWHIDKYVKPVKEEVEKNMNELYKKIIEYEMPKEQGGSNQ